ncbi:MAG: hypothetical protein RDV48_11300 [Candidatus Eremiobacteraeota bacterium]|nr:hypothetical protein [Candidatus Eremiobacteraeota bacterium]
MLFEKETLKNFLGEFFRLHNAAVQYSPGGDDLWTVSLPADLSKFFENSSQLRLCFNRELLPFHADYAFITLGSPVLTSVREAYNDTRHYSCGYLNISASDLAKYKGVPGGLAFAACQGTLAESRLFYRCLTRFNFKLSITTDEKKEELFPVLVDSSSGKMVNPLLLKLKDAGIADSPPLDGKVLPGKPFEELKKKAYQIAEIKVQPLMTALESEFTKISSDELLTAEEFYRRDYATALKDKTLTPQEFEKNKNKSLEEIKKRYEVSFELSLISVTTYCVPLLRNILEVSKNGKKFPFVIEYDFFLERYEDILCPKCGASLREFHLCESHGVHCRSDIWKCGACSKEKCSTCFHLECAVPSCRKIICDECLAECPACGKRGCKTHRAICSACGKEGCALCTKTCRECGMLFCTVHNTQCSTCGEYLCETDREMCAECGKYSCHDHFLQCSVCGKRSCPCSSTKYMTCHKDGKVLCLSHSCTCATCRKPSCSEHLKPCPECRTLNCIEHYVACALCGREYCGPCAASQLKECQRDSKKICPACAVICNRCNKPVCGAHAKKCPECMAESCTDHFVACSGCGKELCSLCQYFCHVCNKTFCSDDVKSCPSCGKPACASHYSLCESCGMKVCTSCIDGKKSECAVCRSLKKIDKNLDPIQSVIRLNSSAFPEMKGFSQWYHGRGNDFFVLRGAGLTSCLQYGIDPVSLEVLSSRKRGLVDRLRGVLGV